MYLGFGYVNSALNYLRILIAILKMISLKIWSQQRWKQKKNLVPGLEFGLG
jgi:hypothetical protein